MAKELLFDANSTTLILNLNGTNLTVTDFIDGEYLTITPLGENATGTYGANNSVNVQRKSDANVSTLSFKVMTNLDSDKELNSFINSDQQSLISGTIKTMYYLNGEQLQETHTITGGFIKNKPTRTRNNTESVNTAEWTIQAYITSSI